MKLYGNGFGNADGVRAGVTITQAQADLDLERNLGVAADRLAARVGAAALLALSEHEYAALLSFVFNLGAAPGWTIWKVLNAGRLDLVPDQLKRFDKARDPRTGDLEDVPGLMQRRLAEVALWRTPDAAAAAAIAVSAPQAPPASSTLRAADTPPAPQAVKPLVASKSFVANCTSAAAGVAACAAPAIGQITGGVKRVSDTIAPYADGNDYVRRTQTILIGVMAILSVTAVVLAWLKHRGQSRG